MTDDYLESLYQEYDKSFKSAVLLLASFLTSFNKGRQDDQGYQFTTKDGHLVMPLKGTIPNDDYSTKISWELLINIPTNSTNTKATSNDPYLNHLLHRLDGKILTREKLAEIADIPEDLENNPYFYCAPLNKVQSLFEEYDEKKKKHSPSS